MKSDGMFRHVAIAAIIAVVSYAVVFSWIEHRRVVKGPWVIAFVTDGNGRPSLRISESVLNISDTVTFPNATAGRCNMFDSIHFDQPDTAVPFGRLIFQDATFLPGTVTMELFGHEVELLPRVLIVDKREYPWHSGRDIEVK